MMLNRRIEGNTLILEEGATTVLTIEEQETDTGILMKLAGQLRSDVAHDIQDELIALTTVGANVEVDFEKVSYISSTTQHVFLRVQQKMDSMRRGSLLLRKMPDSIFREFERTGASELLMIDD